MVPCPGIMLFFYFFFSEQEYYCLLNSISLQFGFDVCVCLMECFRFVYYYGLIE